MSKMVLRVVAWIFIDLIGCIICIIMTELIKKFYNWLEMMLGFYYPFFSPFIYIITFIVLFILTLLLFICVTTLNDTFCYPLTGYQFNTFNLNHVKFACRRNSIHNNRLELEDVELGIQNSESEMP